MDYTPISAFACLLFIGGFVAVASRHYSGVPKNMAKLLDESFLIPGRKDHGPPS